MSLRAIAAKDGMVHLVILVKPPTSEDIGDDGMAALTNVFTKEQWSKLLELDGTDVFGDL